MNWIRICCFVIAIIAVALIHKSKAVFFSAESVNNYDNPICGCGTGGQNLSYCNSKSSGFVERLGAASAWDLDHYYIEPWAYASDFREDEIYVLGQPGHDNTQIDYRDSIAFTCGRGLTSDHGTLSYYEGRLCKYQTMDYELCFYQTKEMKLGELSGSYADPNPGDLRYLVNAGSKSVVYGNAQYSWRWVNDPAVADFHMVLGISSYASDNSYLDELGYDFADKAQWSDWTLVASWWYAIDDWYNDDEAAIVTWGSSTGDANARLNLEKFWYGTYRMFVHPANANFTAQAIHEG